tara:strand:+ start:583 stop:1074 length:492 start_codon:yes stop_codon:yes gene_type:complete
MTNDAFEELLNSKIIPAMKSMRKAGGDEYARTEEDIFANFKRVASTLDLTVEDVMMVYSLKHIDGVIAHCKGHISQREDVRGRITDLLVYLSLLWAYIEDEEDVEEGGEVSMTPGTSFVPLNEFEQEDVVYSMKHPSAPSQHKRKKGCCGKAKQRVVDGVIEG